MVLILIVKCIFTQSINDSYSNLTLKAKALQGREYTSMVTTFGKYLGHAATINATHTLS